MPSSSNSFKSKANELDVDKLKPALVDLKKISHVVDNDVFKKTVYDELFENVNPIKTNEPVNRL